MREKGSPMEVGLRGEKTEKQLKINALALAVKNAKNGEERKRGAEELWLKIRPDVLGMIIAMYNKKDAEDIAHDAYFKLFRSIERWDGVSSNFYTYFFKVVKNSVIDQVRERAAEASRESDKKSDDDSLETEQNRNARNDKIEIHDQIAINQIKSRIVGWVKSGKLEVVEAAVLMLYFGLGEGLIKDLVENFKEKKTKDDPLKNLRNLYFNNLDFDSEMDETSIATLVGYTQGAISKIKARAIGKIKKELNIKDNL